MDDLSKYPTDPTVRVPTVGENTTLALLGHESGHRWLATLAFKDASGASSDLLLGRQRAHWSFFFDSDASFMEGNDIEDLGGGSFRTTAAVQRYSLLDLYAMGQVDASEVPPLFFVEGPSGLSQDRESAPRTGVTFSGRRHDLTIGDIVAAMGPRQPVPQPGPATAPPGLRLRGEPRPNRRPRGRRQAGAVSRGVGAVLRVRDRRPHDPGRAAPLTRRPPAPRRGRIPA